MSKKCSFLPLIAKERSQLTIGLLAPPRVTCPDSLAALGISLHHIDAIPLGEAPVATDATLPISKEHPAHCSGNDPLRAAALAKAEVSMTATSVASPHGMKIPWFDC